MQKDVNLVHQGPPNSWIIMKSFSGISFRLPMKSNKIEDSIKCKLGVYRILFSTRINFDVFHLRNKHVFCAFIAWWKPRRSFGRIREGFHLLENSHKLCRDFQQAIEARKTCFISYLKSLIFSVTKIKMIYEALTVNSHNSETVKPHYLRHFRAS